MGFNWCQRGGCSFQGGKLRKRSVAKRERQREKRRAACAESTSASSFLEARFAHLDGVRENAFPPGYFEKTLAAER